MDNKEEAIKVLNLYGDCSGAKISVIGWLDAIIKFRNISMYIISILISFNGRGLSNLERPENILVFPYSIVVQSNLKLENIVPDRPRYGIKYLC